MGMDNATPTMAELATANGLKLGTAQKKINRAGLQWSAGSPVTDEIADILNGGKKTVKKTATKRAVSLQVVDNTDRQTAQPKTKTDKDQPTSTDKKGLWFFLVVAIPTAVSVGNIYSVSMSIMQGKVEAILLTAVMSAMGPFLLWLDSKSRTVFALALGLIAFEAFANVARIYYGLMGSGSNPVRFVGTVCEIFNSGTHGTALSLAIITSLFIGFVQFVGVNGLKK